MRPSNTLAHPPGQGADAPVFVPNLHSPAVSAGTGVKRVVRSAVRPARNNDAGVKIGGS